MTDWSDVVVRAKGLSAHLMQPAQLTPLCGALNIGVLGDQMAAMDLVPTPADGVPLDEYALELALRRRAGARLRILARWAGPRVTHLTPLFEDEDRRALRALVRGAVAGAPPDERLHGLVPTPALPLRALERLSRAGDLGTIGALLLAWRHPFATVIAAEAMRQAPDLFHLETAMARVFAERARDAARVTRSAMRLFVERTIDLENLWACLVIADHHPDAEAATIFIDGGAIVQVADLRAAAGARSRDELVARLAQRVRRTPLAAALHAGTHPADDGALAAMVAEFRTVARAEPLGLAPVIHFVLRQRAELRSLMRIIWSVSLGVPGAVIAGALGASA